jgi:type III secretion system low calcium response chaperone LcrH/SycD
MTTTDTNAQAKAAAGGVPFETPEEWQNFYEKFGANGRTFQDLTQLTPQSMEVIYMVAFNQYNAGKYDEAEKIFQLLSVLNHFDRRHWTGLGASRENQGKYEEAVKAYGFLAVLDMHDPQPPLLAAKCFLALGRTTDAESALHAAVFNSEGKADHVETKQQAQNLLDLLSKAQTSN